ncbi:hypothetical protein DQM22_12105 [Lactiplantibacillus plantarum]|uniref:DMT family transporter n=1 Tax=Lactiplantibacillus plantarum TaxID=1590 RepID=UPI000E0907DB|nr:DMT family transporter [Lactiplantibacillus plantarum]RDF81336.1 hypothetical protein DQM22_12105 [Lactiplantibacillus plantarum]
MTQQNHLWGVLLASSACILWGISGVAASTLFINNPHLTAMWLTQVRMISAGLILLVWGMVAGKHPFKIWHHRHAAWTAVSYGLLGLIPVQLCYFEAVRVGNAPIATIIQFLGPFIILLGTVAPFLMFARSLSDILPTTASLMDAFEPLAATVFSITFLNVQLTSFDFIGGLLIILAVMALSLNTHKMLHFLRRRRAHSSSSTAVMIVMTSRQISWQNS